MKIAASFLVILTLLAAQGLRGAESIHIALNGDWDFTYTGTSNLEIPQIPPSSAFDAKIEVPGRWDDQLDRFKNTKWWSRAIFKSTLGPVQYLSGIGWHRKSIDVPQDWRGRTTTLTIGSAVGTVHVWLNGKHLGTNDIGVYTPFEINITHEIQVGQSNELIVSVDNAKSNIFGGWALLGNAGMATGLARPVTIDVSPGAGRIADLYIKPGVDLKDVVWQAELVNPHEKNLPASKLQWIVREPSSGRELGKGETAVPTIAKSHEMTWKARLDEIKPWSDHDPNLYITELRWISSDGELIDVKEQRFGLRRWTYQGRKLFLNGEPKYLRLEFGAYYFPIDGAVSMSKDYWLQNMRRVKELGLNGINFAAQVCPIEMMEAADELGVILQCGDEATSQPDGKRHYQRVWNSIVRTTRRYPSISIYGFGGEHKYYEGVIEHNGLQRDLIRSLHPESLVMPQQAIHGIDYGIENGNDPGVKKKPFLHHAERLARYTKACDLFGHYSGGSFSHRYFSGAWRSMDDRFKVYEKPLVAHELFISASYLNPENIKKYTGRIPPYIYTRLENELKEANLIDKWPVYVDHTSRLQHICRKYCLEKARKCEELAGYELLGMTDMHFITPEYAVGIVDEFLEMKVGDTAAGVRKYCDESVLLLDFDNGEAINRCYWEGESFQADAMVSLFGPKRLTEGKLTWRLADGDKKISGETVEVASVNNGHVTTLKQLAFQWPEVKKTTRLKLSLELNGSGYDLKNDWDFWVFPKSTPVVNALADAKSSKVLNDRYSNIKVADAPKVKNLWITSRLANNEIKHLENGGDIVLLGTEPFTAYNRWPYFYPSKGYRPFSNGGTIIAKHPIFAGHPNEGWNDWHFFPLLQGANSVLFDGKIEMAFDPIMEMISSAGHVRKQAIFFEQRVGKGRLLVATAVFDMNNPSCATLMDSLLKYVQSSGFQPKHSLDVEQLARAIAPPVAAKNKLDDSSFEKSGYWLTENGKIEFDNTTAHEGKKALKLVVSEEEFQKSRNASSGVSARQIQFDSRPRRLELSGWFKTKFSDSSANLQVRAEVRLADVHVKSTTLTLPVPKNSAEWQYVKKTFDVQGKINYVSVYVSLTDGAGTAWVDDLYFGEPRTTDNISNAATTPDSHDWQNNATTRKFDSPVWISLNGNEWTKSTTVKIENEGVNTLRIKKSQEDKNHEEIRAYIDLTSPTVTLKIEPMPTQEAGIYTAPSDTEFSITASDNLSGAKKIEVTTDGKTFSDYSKPFKLSPGKHVLKCRVTDRAGNRSKSMTGEWIASGDVEYLEITVMPAK